MSSALESSASASRSDAFCEITPCLPGPIERRRLVVNEAHAGVLCKKGRDLGVDRKGRIAFCTTAQNAIVNGLEVAADSYTLFHPSGAIYQTHLGASHTFQLADGSAVTCGKGSIALSNAGDIRYCQLAGPRSDTPPARVGEGISFGPNGKPSGYTIADDTTISGLAIAAGSSLSWDQRGALLGGYLSAPTAIGPLTIRGNFRLHDDGRLASVTLATPVTVQKHDFPAYARLEFRADGTLERSKYVAERGTMIHGEPWTDTRHTIYAPDGSVTQDWIEHDQSDIAPPSRLPR